MKPRLNRRKNKQTPEPAGEPAAVNYGDMAWSDLRAAASARGIYKVGMKKADVVAALESAQ